jgi:hypothetical protein
MSTKEELEKLTVPQLKEKLKGRKLPISGAKNELVNRLFESIVAEEKLLEATGAGGEMDLNAVDFDAVLGLDEVHKTEEGADKLEDTVEKNEPATATTGTSPSKTTPAVVEQPEQNNANGDGRNGINKPAENNDQSNAENANNANANAVEKEDDDKTKGEKKKMLTTAARLGLPISNDAKKTQRAERFGLSNEDTKAKRAARFGISPPATEDAAAGDDKLTDRAKRFGLPLKRTSSPTGQKDVLDKRAKRFLENDPDQQKKEARAKRFGAS